MALPFDLSLSSGSRSRRDRARRKKSRKAKWNRAFRPRCTQFEQLEQRYMLSTICGTKFNDANGNGIRDTDLLSGENPDVVLLVDVSDSAKFPFFGTTTVPDVNNNGVPNQILDGELQGYMHLNQLMVDMGLGSAARVSIIIYGDNAVPLDMDPGAGQSLATTPLADTDGVDGRDVEQMLRSVLVGGYRDGTADHDMSAGLGNDVEDALQKAIDTFVALGTETGNANLIFMSGSYPTDSSNADNDNDPTNDHFDEVATLNAMQVNIHAFGAGSLANVPPGPATLKTIDPDAVVFTEVEDLEAVFQGGEGGGVNFVEGSLSGVTIQGGGDSDVTDGDGHYCLDVPDNATHTITEGGQAGWAQSNTQQVTVGTGETVDGVNIGNIQVPDFGDAPNGYSVAWTPLSGGSWTPPSEGGARHIPGTTWLGGAPDTEQWGANSATAMGDDNIGDDEDGVVFPVGLTPGQPVEVNVTVGGQTGVLNAWIDFDDDGWEASEQIFTNQSLDAGSHALTSSVVVPTDFVTPTIARFRISVAGGDTIYGLAATGEVEDYALGSISGMKYSDLNGSGDWETGEPVLAGWRIYADVNGNDQYDAGSEPSAVTDTSGNYALFGLLEGTYVLREEGPTGGWENDWDQTEPGPSKGYKRQVTLDAGGDVVDQDFGNRDKVDPLAISFDPPDESDGDTKWTVPLTKNLVITFNEQVKLGAGSIWLYKSDGNQEIAEFIVGSGPVTASGTQITIDPTNNLDPTTEYYVLVEAGAIQDISGNPYAGFTDPGVTDITNLYTWNFSTVPVDFGDAPATYPVTGANAASHQVTGPFLGSLVDGEVVGQPSDDATGDDTVNDADEDGVAFPYGTGGTMTIYTSSISPMNAWVDVTLGGVASAKLDAWIDFDGSGTWEDPGEHIFGGESADLTGGVNALMFTVPQGLTLGTTFARFRVSSGGGLTPGDPANNGEVEDYQITIAEAATVTGQKLFDSDNDGVVGGSEDNTGLGGWTIFQDLDGDGTPDAGESSTVTATDGTYTLPFVPGDYHVREVLRHGWLQTYPTGPSYHSFTPNLQAGESASSVNFGNYLHPDFGDAPAGYPVTTGESGAQHVAIGPTLGSNRDSEAVGTHSADVNSNHDDLDQTGYDDEDGVAFDSLFVSGSIELDGSVDVTLANTGGGLVYLNAWIDFNGNESWDDADEQIFVDRELTGDGVHKLSFTIPAGATAGDTVARFRISTVKLSSDDGAPHLNIGPRGEAPDGEVEDHKVTLGTAATISGIVWEDKDEDGERGDPTIEKGFSPPSTVYLDLDGSGGYDDGEPSTTTKADGTYSLTYGPSNTRYTVRLDPPAGWEQSDPDAGGTDDATGAKFSIVGAVYEVLLDTPGETISNVDFGAIRTIPNRSPVLAYIGDQATDAGVAVEITVVAGDVDGDTLSYAIRGSENRPDNQKAMDLHEQHSFKAALDEYYDYYGQQEKYFQGKDGWYFVLPDGRIFVLTGSDLPAIIGSQTPVATLNDGANPSPYWGDVSRIYDPRPHDYTIAQFAHAVDTEFGFYEATNDLENQYGEGAKYFRGDNGTAGDTSDDPWYRILRGGRVEVWDSTESAYVPLKYPVNSDTVVVLDDIPREDSSADGDLSHYWVDLARLCNAQPASTGPFDDNPPPSPVEEAGVAKIELTENELTITPDAGFTEGSFSVTVHVSDGNGGTDAETFTVTIVPKPNTPPDLEPIDDQTVNSPINIPAIPLSATDPDNDTLTFTATGLKIDPLELRAKQLDEQHGFYAGSSDYRNYSQQHDERFFMGAAGWHFILPNGEIYAWTGDFTTSLNAGPLDTLDGSFHTDLSKLYDAADTALGTPLADGLLTIVDTNPPAYGKKELHIADNSFTGSIVITVTVSDGEASDSESFTVTLEAAANNPPVLAAIDGHAVGATPIVLSVSRTPNPTTISLSATDLDGDEMFWTPDPTASTGDPAAQEVRELDQLYGFYEGASEYYNYSNQYHEKFFRGDAGWYFIMPNNDAPPKYEVYAWSQSFPNSLAAGALASLDAKYYDDLTLLCEPPEAQDQVTAAKAQQLDTDYKFRLINDDYSQVFYDFRNEDEKYFIGTDPEDNKDYWYFIVPNGAIYKWEGSIAASYQAGALDTLSSTYHTQLNLLIEPQSPPTVSIDNETNNAGTSTAVLTLGWPANFDGDITVTINVNDGIDTDSETFTVTVPAAGGEAQGSKILAAPAEYRWQNQFNQLNVNADATGVVSAVDALLVINYLNANGSSVLPALAAPPEIDERFVDVNGDGNCTALDAMIVINHLNAPSAGGEGESASEAVAAVAVTENHTEATVAMSIEAVVVMDPMMAGPTVANAVGAAQTSSVTTGASSAGTEEDMQRPAQGVGDTNETDELEDVLAILADDIAQNADAEQAIDALFAELV